MSKYSTANDPAWKAGMDSLASIFDPKAQAEGAAMLARTRSFDADTRYNTARAVGEEDQNSALADAYLEAAGYTPQERAAIRAARPKSVNDIAAGTNTFRGRTALEAGNVPLGLSLTGQANAVDDYTKGKTQLDLLYPNGTFNPKLAAALAGGVHDIGGAATTLDALGVPVQGFTTPEATGKIDLMRVQGVNDTAQTASRNLVDTARAGAITKTGDAMVDLREAQAGAATTTAESKAENALKLTDAQIELLRKKGVSVEDLTNAKVGTEGAKQGAITQRPARLTPGLTASTPTSTTTPSRLLPLRLMALIL
jgi:hypothetical protein